MNKARVVSVEELDGGWLINVVIGERNYEVGVSRDYFQKLANKDETVEQLVERSFKFLLERESAESIMSRFELSVIGQYFPEYEQTIRSKS